MRRSVLGCLLTLQLLRPLWPSVLARQRLLLTSLCGYVLAAKWSSARLRRFVCGVRHALFLFLQEREHQKRRFTGARTDDKGDAALALNFVGLTFPEVAPITALVSRASNATNAMVALSRRRAELLGALESAHRAYAAAYDELKSFVAPLKLLLNASTREAIASRGVSTINLGALSDCVSQVERCFFFCGSRSGSRFADGAFQLCFSLDSPARLDVRLEFRTDEPAFRVLRAAAVEAFAARAKLRPHAHARIRAACALRDFDLWVRVSSRESTALLLRVPFADLVARTDDAYDRARHAACSVIRDAAAEVAAGGRGAFEALQGFAQRECGRVLAMLCWMRKAAEMADIVSLRAPCAITPTTWEYCVLFPCYVPAVPIVSVYVRSLVATARGFSAPTRTEAAALCRTVLRPVENALIDFGCASPTFHFASLMFAPSVATPSPQAASLVPDTRDDSSSFAAGAAAADRDPDPDPDPYARTAMGLDSYAGQLFGPKPYVGQVWTCWDVERAQVDIQHALEFSVDTSRASFASSSPTGVTGSARGMHAEGHSGAAASRVHDSARASADALVVAIGAAKAFLRSFLFSGADFRRFKEHERFFHYRDGDIDDFQPDLRIAPLPEVQPFACAVTRSAIEFVQT